MSFSASATATSGAKSEGFTTSNWYQGDMVNAWGDGDVKTGAREQGNEGGAGIGGIPMDVLIAGAIIIGAVLWKRLSK